MKVLYIGHCTDLYGASNSMLQMITELKEKHGVEPFVIVPLTRTFATTKNIGDVLKEREIKFGTARIVYFKQTRDSWKAKIHFIISELLGIIQILWTVRNEKIDIVHSNTSVIDIGMYVAKFLNIPHIWHFREVAEISFGLKSLFGMKYQKWIYSKADTIITTSKNVKDYYSADMPEQRFEVIYNGILPPAVNRYANHADSNINICIVGRVEPNKNQLEAVKAINILVKRGYQTVKLFIIGSGDNEYAEKVKQLVSDFGIEDNVVFMGRRDDVDTVLESMNIGLMLSKHEAFGRVTVEYMMHKMCVIASNTSASPELINDGVNGYLYELGNEQHLADLIAQLLDNRRKMVSLSTKAYEDAMAKFKSVQNSDNVYKLYRKILG